MAEFSNSTLSSSVSQIMMIGIDPLENSLNENSSNINSIDISVSIDTMNAGSTLIQNSESKSTKRRFENSDQSKSTHVSSSSENNRSSTVSENDYIISSQQVKSILLTYL